MCPLFDDVSALRSERQVTASVTDIRGPQRCGEMSARLAPSPCDEAWTDVQGGQTWQGKQKRGWFNPAVRMKAGEETEMWREGEEGYTEHMARETEDWKGEEWGGEEKAVGEMITIGTVNGEFICTVQRNPPGRWKEECINREQHWVNEAR